MCETIQNTSIIQHIHQFIFDFQQGVGNAEKFDYVSIIQYKKFLFKFKKINVCLMKCFVVGDELYEEVGRKWVCWFQQCYVSVPDTNNNEISLFSIQMLILLEVLSQLNKHSSVIK